MGIIRTLLALAVVLYHSFGILKYSNTMTGGLVSVQAFYMISGFYMALILNEKYKPGAGSYRLFLTNRFLRIYPVYWVCLFIVIIICLCGQIFYDQPFYLWYWTSKWSVLGWSTILILILSNIFLLGSDMLMFTGINKAGNLQMTLNPYDFNPMTGQFLFIPQIWTVGVELMFYIVAPFLTRTKWYLQVLLITASLYLRWYLFHEKYLQWDPWTYRFFPTELALFMAGSLAYKVYRWLRDSVIPRLTRLSLLSFIAVGRMLWLIIILAIITYPALTFMIEDHRRWYFYGVLFIALPFIFFIFHSNKYDRFIGELSFPIYVCHHFVMFLWRKYFWAHTWHMKWFGITTAVSSIALAIVLYFLVVKRLENYRQKRVSVNAQIT